MELGKSTDGPVSKFINRRISTKITRLLMKYADLDPNKITIITTLVGILSGISFLFLNVWISGTLAQLSSILDGVDGEVARLTGKASKKGGFLDAIMDRIVDIFLLWGLAMFAVQQYVTFSKEILLSIMIFVLSGNLMVSYFNARGEASLGVHPRRLGAIPIATRDVRVFIVFLGCIFQLIYFWSILVALLVIGILSYLFIVINLWIVWRSYSENYGVK